MVFIMQTAVTASTEWHHRKVAAWLHGRVTRQELLLHHLAAVRMAEVLAEVVADLAEATVAGNF